MQKDIYYNRYLIKCPKIECNATKMIKYRAKCNIFVLFYCKFK